ncbi:MULTISPECIES: transglutaminase family protein [unclassified Fusibacter]|uniref:transglutaminase-like domain-containing protein n=1 Tax=unclassified Fusibacter TaxID=2624464 RepID=UPI0013E96D93|nr:MULTISPECIES: transglutaminase-like domain-containing protein [unclassified Fusibacter]MCK8061454.1 transglutaminase-like domain-containing protein [Fusibacter sp. A2]NPE23641.1 transglutaminase domain-containing protein [Fusibacter sp. A1]
MKRKLVVLFVVMIAVLSSFAFADGIINYKPDEGIVKINYTTTDYTKFKIIIKRDTQQYIYNINDNDESFPLQMGSGLYTVAIYQNVSSNKYKKITSASKTVTVNEDAVNLASVQNMSWAEEMKAIVLAKELMADLETDEEKFDAVYDYIIRSIVYDYYKASTIYSRYLPVIDVTLEEKKGICYDYSSLMASMLRSQGIKSKLIEGESTYTSTYHAWNEVYLNGEWKIIDSTVDAQLSKMMAKYDKYKTTTSHVKMKSF